MHTNDELINQYKAHVWSFAEYHNGVITLACESQLARLDSMQRGFLHELSMEDTQAFLKSNFAPPSLRRPIGLLGFVHKRILGECHPLVKELLPSAPAITDRTCHTRQLECRMAEVRGHWRLHERSLYAYVILYNRLPQKLVDLPSVADFQSELTRLARTRAYDGDATWREAYCDCAEVWALHRLT